MLTPDEGQALELGTVLAEKYRLERVIGSGGMGNVFAAWHLQLEETVAVKVLRRERTQTPHAVERFLREARATSRIKSEHVVRVLDAGTLESGAPFIVMECLQGEDFAVRIRRKGPLSVQDAVDVVLQASEAVAEAHSLGIVHRDLKPANLFAHHRPSGTTLVKVLDFGISRIITTGAVEEEAGLTSTHSFLGSPAYVSPEQLTDPGSVDHRTDIWALGVILYELVTGRLPFAANTLALVCTKILQSPPAPLGDELAGAPLEFNTALQRALQKEPGLRYANVLEFARALVDCGSASARASLVRIEVHSRSQVERGAGNERSSLPATETGQGTLTASAVRIVPPRSRRTTLALLAIGALAAAFVGTFVLLRSLGPPSASSSEPSPSSGTASQKRALDAPARNPEAPPRVAPDAGIQVHDEPEASATRSNERTPSSVSPQKTPEQPKSRGPTDPDRKPPPPAGSANQDIEKYFEMRH